MKLIAYSDLHHYSGDRETAIFNKTQKLTQYALPMLDELIEKSNNVYKPDAIVNLGDSIQDANDYAMDVLSLEQVADKIPGFDAPHYMVLGNHDLKMLIQSRRPEYVKNRIRSANGHLCNEDCAKHLKKCITNKTKQIVLAHISEEANTKEKALSVVKDAIGQDYLGELIAASQFEIINGGSYD